MNPFWRCRTISQLRFMTNFSSPTALTRARREFLFPNRRRCEGRKHCETCRHALSGAGARSIRVTKMQSLPHSALRSSAEALVRRREYRIRFSWRPVPYPRPARSPRSDRAKSPDWEVGLTATEVTKEKSDKTIWSWQLNANTTPIQRTFREWSSGSGMVPKTKNKRRGDGNRDAIMVGRSPEAPIPRSTRKAGLTDGQRRVKRLKGHA